MKRRLLAALLALTMALTTGCTSILEREYAVATPHSDTPEGAGSTEALRVENYQEMVNALLYLVTERAETGTLRLYDYDGEQAEQDLTAACTEVSQEDALGAYSVSYLQFDLATIVSYLEADIAITYRRTEEQVDSIQTAIGPTAIRNILGDGLMERDSEVVLQLNYFNGDGGAVKELLQRAYYENPSAAMGMPTAEVEFYPRTGVLRIAEVELSYPMSAEVYAYSQKRMVDEAKDMVADSRHLQDEALVLELCRLVDERCELGESGSTAYATLFGKQATSEGMALGLALLCEVRGVPCSVVQGSVNGIPYFWNVVETEEGYRHLNIATFDSTKDEEKVFRSDREMAESGYTWNRDWVPICGDQPQENDENLELYD